MSVVLRCRVCCDIIYARANYRNGIVLRGQCCFWIEGLQRRNVSDLIYKLQFLLMQLEIHNLKYKILSSTLPIFRL